MIKSYFKKVRINQWIGICILLSPFISLRVHKIYKILLEINWKNIWPNTPIDGIISGGIAVCLLLFAGFCFILHKINP